MRLLLPLFLLLSTTATSLRAEVGILAEAGQPAIGFEKESLVYWSARNPAIGRAGHVAFNGAADTSIFSSAANAPAVWAGLPGEIELVIKENDPIVGLPGNVLFSSADNAQMVVTRSGHLGMPARLLGAVTPNTASVILAHVGGVTQLVLRTGVQAPGFDPGVVVNTNPAFAFTDAGMVVVARTSAGPQGMWFWDFQDTTLLLADGDSAGPDFPGCTLNQIQQFAMNEAGSIVFRSTMTGSGCPSAAIFELSNGPLQKVVAEGDPVPDMAGTVFESAGAFSTIRINDAGDVNFRSFIRRAPAGAHSVWVARAGGALELVALEGESLLGQPNELLVDQFTVRAQMADQARSTLLVFSTTTKSILVGEPRTNQPYPALEDAGQSQLNVVAQENLGQPPGFPATWFFDDLDEPAIGGEDVLVFSATVADALNPIATLTDGIWKGSSAADLEVVAFEGMSIDAFGEQSTITQINNVAESANQSGLTSALSDAGAIIFGGNRSGGAGEAIFLVPEPNAIGALVALATLGVLERRARARRWRTKG